LYFHVTYDAYEVWCFAQPYLGMKKDPIEKEKSTGPSMPFLGIAKGMEIGVHTLCYIQKCCLLLVLLNILVKNCMEVFKAICYNQT